MQQQQQMQQMQQQLMTKLMQQQQQPVSQPVTASHTQQQFQPGPPNPEQILDALASNITEFRFEAEAGITFEAWYSRYEDLFINDAARIDDSAKVRLLMRKLGAMEHEREVEKATCNDVLLRNVYRYVTDGWPRNVTFGKDLARFYSRKDALTTVGNCILFGERVVIPAALQTRCLKQLHQGHPGIQRMKAIARSFVYWPSLDDDITSCVATYDACQAAAKSPRMSAPAPWPKPSAPWQRVHIDYAGPIDGAYFLVAVDAFTKWPEIAKTASITSHSTIILLRGIFARFTLVSDNGTQFTSEVFKEFCDANGIEHITTAPFHPQSNGQAERFVDTFKRALKKIRVEKASLKEALDLFLQTYRSTPNPMLDQHTPAEVMFNRATRTVHHLLRPLPSRESSVNSVFPKWRPGDLVYAKIFRGNSWSWIAGEIIRSIGTVMYEVITTEQRRLRRHVNQLRRRTTVSRKQGERDEDNLPLQILLKEWGLPAEQSSTPVSEPSAPVSPSQPDVSASSPAAPVFREAAHPSLGVEDVNHQQARLPRRSSRSRRLPRRFSAYRLN
ncbi:uncharacterized protein K02A2.6-like [Anopheles merus]|uniref:uncharacterized protein K02A2.6-like n=1 Tax=Anopheles merus TaxID=30066 RepID=UPI001BE48F9E|nr:uncharacterized protein K02A2.6-like [Anopheles merus]